MGICFGYNSRRICIYYDYKFDRFLLLDCIINGTFGYNYHIPTKNNNLDNPPQGCFGYYNLPKKFKFDKNDLGVININKLKELLINNSFDNKLIEIIQNNLKSNPLFENK